MASHHQCTGEGDRGCNAQVVTELIRTGLEDHLVQSPAHRQRGSSSAARGRLSVVQAHVAGMGSPHHFWTIFPLWMFIFFALMFNTNVLYVNLSPFPSALPTVDTEKGILSPSLQLFSVFSFLDFLDF